MLALLVLPVQVALAQDLSAVGFLQIPLTPSNPHTDVYHGLAKKKDAEGRDWASDTPGVVCVGTGDLVEFTVTRGSWPSHLGKKVTCTSGKDKAAVKVVIRDDKKRAMVVGDGTVVMPRLRGETAHFEGPGPRSDLVVGIGKVSGLGATCKAKPNGVIDIEVSGNLEDGEGICGFRNPHGETVAVPFLVRTLKE